MAKILLVDDTKDIRVLLRVWLRLAGHEVVEASDGREALSMLAEVAPDIVLLDVQMPHLDGRDVIREIRAKQEDLPVVFVTVKRGIEDFVDGWKLGCDGYLTKPFDEGEVLAEVNAVLSRSSSDLRSHRRRRLDELLARWAAARAGTTARTA